MHAPGLASAGVMEDRTARRRGSGCLDVLRTGARASAVLRAKFARTMTIIVFLWFRALDVNP
jgi:hypothetical protein